jgi:hypothetical protein
VALSPAGKRCRAEQREAQEWTEKQTDPTKQMLGRIWAEDWFAEEVLLGESEEQDD